MRRRRIAAGGLLLLLGGMLGLIGLAPGAAAQSDDPCLDNIPEQVPVEDLSDDPTVDGAGGTLPSVLSSAEVADILAEVYARLPDVNGDGFPDLPDDADGNPDFDELDRLLRAGAERRIVKEAGVGLSRVRVR